MLAFHDRAVRATLAILGEPSTLDGLPCDKVNIEFNASLFAGDPGRSDDNHVAQADVATILSVHNPAVGKVLVHPQGTFVLTRLWDDNGYARRYVIARP